MAGRGYIEEAEKIDTSHIKILRNGRWHSMFRPINPDRSFAGVSLAESFAEQYAKEHGVDVGLICCADGGTSLEQWKPNSLLFDHAVSQARLAQRTSVVSGILWHQGEADCAKELYSTYEVRLKAFMDALRSELDLHNVPFLLGGLGDFLADCPLSETLKNYTYVNDALENVARDTAMTGFVSAEGLSANPDQLHFSAKALYELGLRYYREFEKIAVQNDNQDEAAQVNDTYRSEMELL